MLAGREELLGAFEVTCRRIEATGEGDRGWVLNGLRGVGKTVLLNELMRRVDSRGWIVAKVEAGGANPLSVALDNALVRSMRTATGRHPVPRLRRLLGVLKAFGLRIDPNGVVSLGVDVDTLQGVADSGSLSADLAALFEVLGQTARDLGVGVLILVDELQEASLDELAAVDVAVHELGQAGSPLPLVFVGAGLPSLPAQLADATSYAERLYDYRPVGLLDDDGARDAVEVPARDLDVHWEPRALSLALEAARGYPYFLQAIGKHVWDNARGDPINEDDVEVGLRSAREEVDDGLYRSRWERATPAQRDLMRALARLGGDLPASVSDIAKSMGKARTPTSP